MSLLNDHKQSDLFYSQSFQLHQQKQCFPFLLLQKLRLCRDYPMSFQRQDHLIVGNNLPD